MDLSIGQEFYDELKRSITSSSQKDSSSPGKLITPTVLGTPESIRPTGFDIPESIFGTPDIRYFNSIIPNGDESIQREIVYLLLGTRNESKNIVEIPTIESDQNMVQENKKNESMNIFEIPTIESDQNMVPEKEKHPGGRKKKWKSKKVVEPGRIIFENAEELSQFQKENKEYIRRYRQEVKQGIRTPAKQQKRGRPRKLGRTPDGKHLTADEEKMKTKRRTKYMKEYRKKKRTN